MDNIIAGGPREASHGQHNLIHTKEPSSPVKHSYIARSGILLIRPCSVVSFPQLTIVSPLLFLLASTSASDRLSNREYHFPHINSYEKLKPTSAQQQHSCSTQKTTHTTMMSPMCPSCVVPRLVFLLSLSIHCCCGSMVEDAVNVEELAWLLTLVDGRDYPQQQFMGPAVASKKVEDFPDVPPATPDVAGVAATDCGPVLRQQTASSTARCCSCCNRTRQVQDVVAPLLARVRRALAPVERRALAPVRRAARTFDLARLPPDVGGGGLSRITNECIASCIVNSGICCVTTTLTSCCAYILGEREQADTNPSKNVAKRVRVLDHGRSDVTTHTVS